MHRVGEPRYNPAVQPSAGIPIHHYPSIRLPECIESSPPERCPVCDAAHVAPEYFADWDERPLGVFSYRCGAAYGPPEAFYIDFPPTPEQAGAEWQAPWLVYQECMKSPPVRTLAILCLWHRVALDAFVPVPALHSWLDAAARAYRWPTPPIWLSLGNRVDRYHGPPPSRCPVCHAPAIPSTPFCDLCGTTLGSRSAQHCPGCGAWTKFASPRPPALAPRLLPFDYHQYRCNATYHASGWRPFPSKDAVERRIPIAWTGYRCYRPPARAVIDAAELQSVTSSRPWRVRLHLARSPSPFRDVCDRVRAAFE